VIYGGCGGGGWEGIVGSWLFLVGNKDKEE
jgi:hypothetical protein